MDGCFGRLFQMNFLQLFWNFLSNFLYDFSYNFWQEAQYKRWTVYLLFRAAQKLLYRGVIRGPRICMYFLNFYSPNSANLFDVTLWKFVKKSPLHIINFEMSFWCLHFFPKKRTKTSQQVVKSNLFVRLEKIISNFSDL